MSNLQQSVCGFTFQFESLCPFLVSNPFFFSLLVLSRVQAFLPKLEASNAILAQRAREDSNSIDIEHIPDGMDQYIEMASSNNFTPCTPPSNLFYKNLGLGIYEDRSHNDSEKMSISSSSDTTSDISERDNDPDSDMDSDASSEIITSFVPWRPIKPLPRRLNKPRPEIVVLGEV